MGLRGRERWAHLALGGKRSGNTAGWREGEVGAFNAGGKEKWEHSRLEGGRSGSTVVWREGKKESTTGC